MSLIDEALKRARMEAAQKAAESEGLPYPTIPRNLGPRRRRAWLAPVVVALAVVAGVAVGLLLASRGEPAAEQSAMRRGELGSANAGSPPAAAESPVHREAPEDQPRPEPISPARQPATGGTASPPAATAAIPPRTADQPAATPAPAPAIATSPPSSSPRPSSPPPADPEPPTASLEQPTAPPEQPTATAPLPAAAPSTRATTVTDPDSGVLLVLPERTNPGSTDGGGDAVSESYVQQYPLPNGGAIELGGIAWSETGPFALINGRVVGPGSIIETYTLEQIRPGHVVLTGAGLRIRLSLR